jgi:hypothetical protein
MKASHSCKLVKVTGTPILARPPPPRRPATDRTINAASIDVTMPTWFATVFQDLLKEQAMNVFVEKKGRIVARDLHERAIRDLVKQITDGKRVMFLAPPTRDSVRKKLQIDGDLKCAVERIADSARVTRASVVMTAFHHFFETAGLLRSGAASISDGA